MEAAAKKMPGGGETIRAKTETQKDHIITGGGSQGIYSAIPAEMKSRPQWLAWLEAPNPDPTKKPIKIPVDVHTGRKAKSTDPNTWATFETVLAFLDQHQGHEHRANDALGIIRGPGFVFTPDDPFTGIDLDKCLIDDEDKSSIFRESENNPHNHRAQGTGENEWYTPGELLPWAEKIVMQFDSYTEVSHSGNGLHIIIEGKKPAGSGCKRGDIECYDHGRYFAITGNLYGERGRPC